MKPNRGSFLIAMAMDVAFGDPRGMPHPVDAIAALARTTESRLRTTSVPLRIAGCLAWLIVIAAIGGAVRAIRRVAPRSLADAYLIYSFLALRSLDDHARAVIKALEEGDLLEARTRVGLIVGRDTGSLDAEEIMRAVVETVAENLNDGVIAPLFFLGLGGPVAMAAYKAANTLDSLFGHKTDRYREFGWASARMDDLLNLIPARLAAATVAVVAAWTPGLSVTGCVRAILRDAWKQPSPNSGYGEAAFAGALGVQLGGTNYYAGVPVIKESLGDPIRPLRPRRYGQVRYLLYASSILFAVCVLRFGRWR